MKKKKTSLKKELLDLKTKIEKLKENIQKLIGEEKYKYIIEISSIGIKDDSMQEEVKIKIESFIKDNCANGNEDEMHEILSLFNSECQYYKKQQQFNKLL